jgi:hyperosmotically inducible periplasmic protein
MRINRTDMRNKASTVSRLLIAATIALPAFAFTAGCQSTPQANPSPPNPSALDDSSDAALAARVKQALAADPELSRLPISVATYRGTAQLAGYVESEMQIQKAVALARSVRGVQSVSNELHLRTQ